MATLAPIQGSMVLDPSAYIAGLNQAAGATRSFQQGVSTISFAGFNRGIFATTTLLYGLERIISRMSQGMEEYANMLGRIGTVADLTAASVAALAESMKSVSVMQGVSRRDIMGGMYTAAQAGYGTPAEMRAMSMSGAKLSRASGKEIDVKKSVDLMSGIRQALGIGSDAISSNRMTDILLRGRDVGRWELDQMAHALGIPLTVWGNQFAGKQSGEETLRQLVSVMSVASLAGVSPNMTATGTRRIVEKTLQLNKSGKMADPLRNALRGQGFNGPEPIMEALNQGGMKYLNTLMKITGGSSGELTRMGYGSRDLLVLTSALRGQGAKLNQTYEELAYGNTAGTTERYAEKMRGTYDYTRDRLRSQWEITSQQFMQASIPLIGQFTNMLEGFNKVAQALPESVKSFMMLMSAMAAMRLFLNFFGFRVGQTKFPLGGGAGRAAGAASSGSKMSLPSMFLSSGDPQTARLLRKQNIAAGRPYSRYLTPQASPVWQGTSPLSGSSSPDSLAALGWLGTQPKYGAAEQMRLEALRNRYAPMTLGGIPMASGKYGPTLEQRIRWAAYKQGQSVNFATGSYGSLSPTAQGYFAGRGQAQGSQSIRELRDQSTAFGRGFIGRSGVMTGNMIGQIGGEYATPSMARQLGRYVGASGVFAASGLQGDTGMYRSLGVNSMMQATGVVTSGLMKFGSALLGVLKPMAIFSGAMIVLESMYQGITYKKSGSEMEGGLEKIIGGNLGYNALTAIPHTLRFGLAELFNRNDIGDMSEEFGRKYGAVADGKGKGWSMLGSWLRTGNISMAGYRDANMNDVAGITAREQLSPGMVAQFRKGGINFEDFGSMRGYLNEHLKGMGKKAPDDWNAWLRSTPNAINTAAEWLADALKGAADKIAAAGAESAKKLTGRVYGTAPTRKVPFDRWGLPHLPQDGAAEGKRYYRQGGHYYEVPTEKRPIGDRSGRAQPGYPDWNAVAKGISPEMRDALVNSRILSGRQWDIYSGADYSGRGNGGLNWGAGGRDYRAMYAQELANLDTRFGGFTDQSFSANFRDPLSYKGGGLRALMGRKGQFEDNGPLSLMLGEGDKDFAKNQKLREFLKVMPDIGTMPEAEAMGWFSKMTGRDPMTDVYAKANFDNFRNMNVADYVTAEQVRPPTQYASATQFGTAEAYNQLLQRDNPTEKLNIAIDKLATYFETFTVTKEQAETELQKVTKAAATFFEDAKATNFFANMQDMAIAQGD